MDDVRAAGLCSAGARHWLRRHGYDWLDFLAHGLPAARLECHGDSMAQRAIDLARRRHG